MKDNFDQLFLRCVRELVDSANKEDGLLKDKRVSVNDLARVFDVYNRWGKSKHRPRWPLACAFLISMLVASVLMFAHVEETEIELDLEITELEFQLNNSTLVNQTIQLASVAALGLSKVEIGRQTYLNTDYVRIGIIPEDKPSGVLTIPPMIASPDSRVSVRAKGPHLNITITPASEVLANSKRPSKVIPAMDLAVDGNLSFSLSGKPSQTLSFSSPQRVALYPISSFDLDLVPAQSIDGLFSQARVTGLKLSKVEQVMGETAAIARRSSSILGGNIYQLELDGKEQPIRRGQRLYIGESTGEIRILELIDGHLRLKYIGQVQGLETGSDTQKRTLMPTYLEWLASQHGLGLLWGSTAFVFSLALALLRWWGITE